MRGDRRRSGLALLAIGLAGALALDAPATAIATESQPVADALAVGTRLTWSSGDATLEGTKLVPDANGWLWKDDQWWSVQSTGGTGGVGLTQLDIVANSPAGVVADVRYFLNTDLARGTHVSSGTNVAVGDASALVDWWIAPTQLAALQEGVTGQTRIWRGQRVVGGQSFDVVSSATSGTGSYISYTYDLATGLLLVAGSMNAGPGVLITDEAGNPLDESRGSVTYTHRQFVGARQVAVPWAGQPPPGWVAANLTTTYAGLSRGEMNTTDGLPQPAGQATTARLVLDRQVGDAWLARQFTAVDTGIPGIAPTEVEAARAFGSNQFDGLWIPVGAFDGLQPQQVLDQDPLTGQSVAFAGVVGTSGVIVSTTAGDQLEQHFDLRSGLLVFTRYEREMVGVGSSIVELSLVGQN